MKLITDTKKISEMIPSYVWYVSNKLWKNGFEAYLVGGAVRDIIMGRIPKDYDIATSAEPSAIQRLFSNTVATGARFGTITVLSPTEDGENIPVEVTTYRCEENYIDGRWPSKVVFTKEILRDLGRRNFTINAIAFSLHPVKSKREILDPFDGIKDIKRKIIRAVGTSLERMKEDGLRGFIACRQASVLGFSIEKETFEAIKKSIPVAKMVSIERIRDEFLKLIYDSPKPSVGIEYLRESGLLELFIPELLEGLNVPQKKFHVENVYYHLLHTCDKAADIVKIPALFHDIGKPRCRMPSGNFYGHDIVGAQMTKQILKRLKFPKAEIKRVSVLVRYHMFWYREEWTDSAVRRLLRKIGGEEMFDQLIALRLADSQANPKAKVQPWAIKRLQERIAEIKQQDMALKVSDLAINGKDLIEAGVPQNKRMSVILNYLLDKVIENPLENTKDKLLSYVRLFIDHNFELLWIVDDRDMPVGKGYIEEVKSKGLCYRWVEFVVTDGKGKVLSLGGQPLFKGFCFPEEGYQDAVRRIGWESAKIRPLTRNGIKKVAYFKEKDESGVCRFVTFFIIIGRSRAGEWVDWNKAFEINNARLKFLLENSGKRKVLDILNCANEEKIQNA